MASNLLDSLKYVALLPVFVALPFSSQGQSGGHDNESQFNLPTEERKSSSFSLSLNNDIRKYGYQVGQGPYLKGDSNLGIEIPRKDISVNLELMNAYGLGMERMGAASLNANLNLDMKNNFSFESKIGLFAGHNNSTHSFFRSGFNYDNFVHLGAFYDWLGYPAVASEFSSGHSLILEASKNYNVFGEFLDISHSANLVHFMNVWGTNGNYTTSEFETKIGIDAFDDNGPLGRWTPYLSIGYDLRISDSNLNPYVRHYSESGLDLGAGFDYSFK